MKISRDDQIRGMLRWFGLDEDIISELLAGKDITITSAEIEEVFGDDVNLPDTFNLEILLDKLNVDINN